MGFQIVRQIGWGVVVMTALAGCPQNTTHPNNGPSRQKGGFDGGGGGNVPKSSADDVQVAIKKVRTELIRGSGLHVFRRALPRITTETDARVEIILQQMIEPKNDRGRVLYKKPEDYLKTIRYDIRTSGACRGPLHQGERDGSVDRLSFGATMCLSVERLRRLPKEALFDHVLALVVHEVVHINGFNEAEANLVQQFFLDNINSILARDGEEIRKNFFNLIDQARMVYIRLEDVRSSTYDQDCTECPRLLGKLESLIYAIQLTLPDGSKLGSIPVTTPELKGEVFGQTEQIQMLLDRLRENPLRFSETDLYGLKTSLNQLRGLLAIYLFGESPEVDWSKVNIEH